MSDRPRNYRKDLRAIFNGVAESILSASDEEILAEYRDAGLDPDSEATAVRNLLLSAVREARLNTSVRARDSATPVVKLTRRDQLLLSAIRLLPGKAYGLSICEKIEELMSREPNPVTVYVALNVLERQGLVVSWYETSEYGPSYDFKITAAGERALAETEELAKDGLDALEDFA